MKEQGALIQAARGLMLAQNDQGAVSGHAAMCSVSWGGKKFIVLCLDADQTGIRQDGLQIIEFATGQ